MSTAVSQTTADQDITHNTTSVKNTNNSTLFTLVTHISTASPQSHKLLPHLRRWQQLYGDVGLRMHVVNCPQFSFERDTTYLDSLPAVLNLSLPIVEDLVKPTETDHNLQLWPRLALTTNDGTVICQSIGNDGFDKMEDAIRAALTHAGCNHLPPNTQSGEHIHRLGSQCFPAQPDAFTGLLRAQYKNTHPGREGSAQFTDPLDMANFGLSLQGQWSLNDESVQGTPHTTPDDYLSFAFSGFEVSALLEPLATQPAIVSVTLNGQPLTPKQAGSDLTVNDGLSTVEVTQPRLYQLLRSDHYFAPADLRLHPRDGQFAAYLFAASGCRPE